MEKNLTTGSVFKNIVYFSLPYLLSYFLQTLYGMADLFIVGQFEKTIAETTAVSIGSQVMHMLTVMIVGRAMGTTVSIGQAIGANNKKVAKVNAKGTVAAVAPGKVVITGTRNGVKRTCTLYVLDQKLSTTKLSLKVGKYKTLTLTGAVSKVAWKTSNSKIVAVNQKGLIKAKKKGTAVISATHAGKVYKCTVTVK